jgi:hypothetical protein
MLQVHKVDKVKKELKVKEDFKVQMVHKAH